MENLNFNIISLIDIVGLVQGIFWGIILIWRSKKNKSLFWLALFLITFSLELLNTIFNDLMIVDRYPLLLFLPIDFEFLFLPLFFLYIKHVSNNSLNNKDYWVLVPGMVEFLIFLTLFLMPIDIKERIQQKSTVLETVDLIAVLFRIFFMVKILLLLRVHRKTVENFYSNLKNRLLQWAKYIVLFLFVEEILLLFIFDLPNFEVFGFYLFVSVINVVFIFWAGFSGLLRTKTLDSNIQYHNPKAESKYNSGLLNETHFGRSDYELLKQIVIEKKLYKLANLSLIDLSKEAGLSTKNVSFLINEYSGKNFNQFINHYRIEEAIKILSDDSKNNLNMYGVACESGFSSMSTFFAVFKQFTQKTPSAFRKNAASFSPDSM